MPNDVEHRANWPTWMIEQHRTFMAQLFDERGNSAWIGVASVDNILGRNGKKTQRRGGEVELLESEPEAEVFVWKPHEEARAPELWIAPERRNYRSTYARFLKAYWPGSDINEVPNHVDHVFPKDSAQLGGLSHVRLLAVPKRSNVSAGTLEKEMKARTVELGARQKETRLATLYSLGKAAGYVGFSGLDTPDGRREIAARVIQALREAGAPEVITESNLDEALLAETLLTLR